VWALSCLAHVHTSPRSDERSPPMGDSDVKRGGAWRGRGLKLLPRSREAEGDATCVCGLITELCLLDFRFWAPEVRPIYR